MPPDLTNQTVLQLGLAAPLIMILVYLLWQSNQERRETTGKFLDTLQSTIKTNAEVTSQNTNAMLEMKNQASAEHREMIAELRHMTDALKGASR
jgi:hypothetical protein